MNISIHHPWTCEGFEAILPLQKAVKRNVLTSLVIFLRGNVYGAVAHRKSLFIDGLANHLKDLPHVEGFCDKSFRPVRQCLFGRTVG